MSDYFVPKSEQLATDGAPPPLVTESDLDPSPTPPSKTTEPENTLKQPEADAGDDVESEDDLGNTPPPVQQKGSQGLHPDDIVAVLGKEQPPPPKPDSRFLHGGPPLSELDAPSTVPLGAVSRATKDQQKNAGKPVANARWRAFTDQEEVMLQEGWEQLEKERGEQDGKAEKEIVDRPKDSNGEEDPDLELPHCYPAGLDHLFTVDLSKGILAPAFWSGTPVRVIQAHWFYPPSSSITSTTQSHALKPYPVDPQLAAALDRAYASIRPWEESYSMELASALKGGAAAQLKLSTPLNLENESGANAGAEAGIEVIFTSESEGRVYSKGIIGSVGKSFLSSGSGLGGGQVVIRGWQAMKTYHERKAAKSKAKTAASRVGAASIKTDTSDSSREPSPARPSSRRDSNASKHESKPSDSGFFGFLKSKIYGPPAADGQDEQDQPATNERHNETSEAMSGMRSPGGESGLANIGEADELVLVCHGIGQKLAGQYESFNFVHAVNQLRNACTTLSTSPTLAPLLHSKRAQFIPLLWRTDLQFDDEVDSSQDSEEEHLRNRYNLEDIEIKGSVPFLRQVVSGLVLDVPFYLSHHKQKMTRAVVKEANRIYRLYCARNPSFATKGRVSIIAHSLGSALAADILSNQPTHVKPLTSMSRDERFSETHFVFDTRTLILVGSPLAFFMHLGKGQLIARAGRERTKKLGRDIALDRSGRYGCMAVDSVYNVYHETDPVAFALNPTVDVQYAKLIKPIAIPSTNHTLLENLSETYQRFSKMLTWSSNSTTDKDKTEEQSSDKAEGDEANKTDDAEGKPPASKAVPPPPLTKRPTNKRMPSERPMNQQEFEAISRAERRFKALNPNGCIDFFLPAEGFNQYVEALSSHGSYWNDPRFSNFVLLQLFAAEEDLERTGREEIGEADDEE